jgi:hypothetical protein
MAKRTVQAGPRTLAATGSGATPPAAVLQLSASADVQANSGCIVRARYKPPADELFKGVRVFLEAPAVTGAGYAEQGSTQLDTTATAPSEGRLDMGRFKYDAADLDDDGFITVTLEPVPAPTSGIETWRLFAPSYGDAAENQPAMSASVTFEVQAIFGVGEEYSPHVRNLQAAVETEFRDLRWQYRYVLTWENPTAEQVPDRWQLFAGVELVLRPQGGEEARPRVEGTQQRYESAWADMAAAQHWDVLALAYDKWGNVNTENRWLTPKTSFDVGAKPQLSDVQNFAVTAEYRDGALILTPTWDEPVEDEAWGYIQLRCYIAEATFWNDLSHPARSGDEARLDPQFWPDHAQPWDLYAVSVDKGGNPKWPTLADPGTSPKVTVTIPAPPAVPNVENWNVIAGTGYDDVTGLPDVRLSPNFDKPADASWAAVAVRIHIQETNGWLELPTRVSMPISENPASLLIVPNEYVPLPGVLQNWDVYAVTQAANGRLKYPDLTDPGDSPMVTVTVQSPEGAGGEEYCANPAVTLCEVFYPTPGADGVEVWGFRYTVVNPEGDERYRGCKPIAIDATNRRQPLANLGLSDGGQVMTSGPFPFGADNTFTVWFPGMDSAGRVNGLVEGTCPNVKGLHPVAQTSGKLNPNRLDPAKVDDRIIIAQDGSGKFTLRMRDEQNIGIGASGLELNGVPLGLARAGTYDETVFSADPTEGFKQIAVDFSLPKLGTFDTNMFEVTGGTTFKAKLSGQFTAGVGGIAVSQIDCDILKSGNIVVGNITGRPAGVFAYKQVGAAQELVAWFGHNNGIVGGWAKEFYIGGTGPGSTAKVYCDAAGNAYFSGTLTACTINSPTIYGATIFTTSLNVGTVNGTAASGVYAYRWNGFNNVLVGWVGSNSSYYGGWMQEFYMGGSGPSTAKVYCDQAGNATFSGAIATSAIATSSFTLSNAYGYLTMAPAAYDPTYASLGVFVSNTASLWTDAAWHVSRGFVVHSSVGAGPNGQVGALVREPTSNYAGQLVLYGYGYNHGPTSGNYVLCSGASGTVRADNGFIVRGNIGFGTPNMPQRLQLVQASGGAVSIYICGGLITNVTVP